MTYIVTLEAYEDNDFAYSEHKDYSSAIAQYNKLNRTFDDSKHIYLDLILTDETLYRPTNKTLKIRYA